MPEKSSVKDLVMAPHVSNNKIIIGQHWNLYSSARNLHE